MLAEQSSCGTIRRLRSVRRRGPGERAVSRKGRFGQREPFSPRVFPERVRFEPVFLVELPLVFPAHPLFPAFQALSGEERSPWHEACPKGRQRSGPEKGEPFNSKGGERIMVAVPVFGSRVAPVLNWCSRVLVFSQDDEHVPREELVWAEADAFRRMRMLQQMGVRTLICGALSPELLRYGEALGLNIVYGVAGEVEAVLQAHHREQLDQPCFWLPGCRCRRRYRSTAQAESCIERTTYQERSRVMPGKEGAGGGGRGQGRGGGRGQGRGGGGRGRAGAGPGGECLCPSCGAKVPHEAGIPCPQVKCPQCGQAMVRE